MAIIAIITIIAQDHDHSLRDGCRAPRIIRALVNKGLLSLHAIHGEHAVPNGDHVPGLRYNALDKGIRLLVAALLQGRRRLEDDDIIRVEVVQARGKLVDQELVADVEGRVHGQRRDVARLQQGRAHQKRDREGQREGAQIVEGVVVEDAVPQRLRRRRWRRRARQRLRRREGVGALQRALVRIVVCQLAAREEHAPVGGCGWRTGERAPWEGERGDEEKGESHWGRSGGGLGDGRLRCWVGGGVRR